MHIIGSDWGETAGGEKVTLYTLINGVMKVSISDYGGVVTQIFAPDREGNPEDVVLGYDTLDEYMRDTYYFGAIIGRSVNRISNAVMRIGEKEYELNRNYGKHHHHGGEKGFHTKIWKGFVESYEGNPCLRLSCVSPDMESGYPGALQVEVSYTLLEDSLKINFTAETEKLTYLDMTSHIYFNLRGGCGDCLDHKVKMISDSFVELDNEGLPTGKILKAEGVMDFREMTTIAEKMDVNDLNLAYTGGYDHYFVMGGKEGAAKVYDPVSGRTLEMVTDCSGFQFYTGNHIQEGLTGKGGIVYGRNSGLCLEAHNYPDALNKGFPADLLKPGDKFKREIIYKFSVDT